MFADLSKYENIFVTGPHRSGTTIAAKMIAQDTGHDLVLEDEFSRSNLTELSTFLQYGVRPMVIQCPFLSNIIHDMNYLLDVDMNSSLVVFMHRDRDAIIRSEAKAPVDFNRVAFVERCKYHSNANKHISDVKKDAWKDQKTVIPHSLDQEYSALSAHPLWRDDHTTLEFEHEISTRKLQTVFEDGLAALANA